MEKIKKFPLSVGFGRLNVENSEILSADYFFNNRSVHKIID
jgi:hypothetical protein